MEKSSFLSATDDSEHSLSKNLSSDSFEEVEDNNEEDESTYRDNNAFFLDEDHFSIHSDIDFLDDINDLRSNLSREEQLELTISKYIAYLRSLTSPDQSISDTESEEKKRTLVKKICDLKVKLAKLKEDGELMGALKDRLEMGDSLKEDLSATDSPIMYFKRTYSFTKFVSGHKLVLSSDIYDNEKRLRSLWKTQIRATPPPSPVSQSPSSSSHNNANTSPLSQSLPTSRLLHLLNSTSNHLSYITNACSNWAANSAHHLHHHHNQATNPFAQLVCDCCLKRLPKSFNEYFMDAFKFSKKSTESHSINLKNCSQSNSSLSSSEISGNSNPYLVCIYCFFTIHLNCLTRNIRKCPKLIFDDIGCDELIDEHCSKFYNINGIGTKTEHKVTLDQKSKRFGSSSSSSTSSSATSGTITVNTVIELHQKRMRRVILKICPQIGLAKQDFRCAECNVLLSPSSSPPKDGAKPISKPRLCDYFGRYFCENCHINDMAVIPARVIHNWDFRPQPVSRVALQIISYLRNTSFHFDRPVLFNLVELNPMLYGLVDELIQIKRLRSELSHIYKYILLCKQPSKPRHWIALMCQLGSHLLNEQEINYLSLTDISDLKLLANNLSELESFFIFHITSCESCRGKGFFCELCPNKDDILFPFSPNTTTCSQCYAVYHKNCYFRRNRLCPRCNRIKDKFVQQQQQQQQQQQLFDQTGGVQIEDGNVSNLSNNDNNIVIDETPTQ